jgi:hypothetical protein
MDPIIYFWIAAGICVAVIWFVASETRNYNLTHSVPLRIREGRERVVDLRNRNEAAEETGDTIPNRRAIRGAELCTEEAQHAIDLEPTNIRSWHSASRFVKRAERQLNAVRDSLAGSRA